MDYEFSGPWVQGSVLGPGHLDLPQISNGCFLPPSPDCEDPPSWPSASGPVLVAAPGSSNTSGSGDVRSPSLSSDEQSSEASLITEGGGGGAPLPPDTPDNLALLVLDSVAEKQGLGTGEFCSQKPSVRTKY